MLGGALVFGAVPRWAKSGKTRHACLLALGLVILAHSRPYEGLVAVITPMLWFVISTIQRLRVAPARTLRGLAAGCLLLAVGGIGMLVHNRAVTGDPFKLPYQIWKETYSRGGLGTTLLWSGVERNQNVLGKLLIEWEFFVRMLLTLPLGVGILRALGSGKHLIALLACLLTLEAVLMQNTRGNPHYLAAVVAPFTAICILGLRRLNVWRWRKLPVGNALARGLLMVYVVSFGLAVDSHWIREPVPAAWHWSFRRDQIQSRLAGDGGRHLVFVRYRRHHSWFHEWCYNSAAIDDAPVVWVQSRDPDADAAVAQYFSERRCWVIEADDDDAPLATYRPDRG